MVSFSLISTFSIHSTPLRRPNKLVWHGASNKMGLRDLNHNCDGWHSDSLTKFGYATPLHSQRSGSSKRRQRKRHLSELANHGLTNQTGPAGETGFLLEVADSYPCRMPLVVLCIETIGQLSNFNKNNDDVESNLVLN